jgi:hypothetical protein
MAKSEEFGKVLACPVIQGEARKALAGLIKSQDLHRFRHLELPRIDLHTAADQRSPVQIYDTLQEAHGIGCAFEALELEVRGAYSLKDLTVASSPSIQYSASADEEIAHRMSSNLGLNKASLSAVARRAVEDASTAEKAAVPAHGLGWEASSDEFTNSTRGSFFNLVSSYIWPA